MSLRGKNRKRQQNSRSKRKMPDHETPPPIRGSSNAGKINTLILGESKPWAKVLPAAAIVPKGDATSPPLDQTVGILREY
jgi:hypothetical protein